MRDMSNDLEIRNKLNCREINGSTVKTLLLFELRNVRIFEL